ncbi:MAG TPA: hypothetical protein EYM25_01865 [Deltaproteobacteria bacterium]|nr:hypothetical protein [Deltaproteobacteria bacterium]
MTGIRFALALALCAGLAFPVSAQALLKIGSARPDEVLTYEEEQLSATTVQDNSSTTIDGSRLGLTTRRRAVNLYFLYVYDDLNLLSYQGETALASALSDNLTVSASGADLPATLQERGWFAYLPLGIGSTRLQLRGGSALASDTKDVSSEDFHTFMSLLLTLNRQSSSRWSIGAFRQAFLGMLGNWIPLAQFESVSSDSAWSLGFVHVPGYYDQPVFPYFTYNWETRSNVALELIYPRKFSLFAFFSHRWSLLLELEKESSYYRLSKASPWNSTVLRSEQFRQLLRINYHLFGNITLGVGSGNSVDRRFTLYDKNLNQLRTLTPEVTALHQGHVAFTVYF